MKPLTVEEVRAKYNLALHQGDIASQIKEAWSDLRYLMDVDDHHRKTDPIREEAKLQLVRLIVLLESKK